MNFFRHLYTIIKHKIEVMKLCFKCGLYWQGIIHDFSKFSITEFSEGIKYFDGSKSPIDICRQKNGISYAWLHHKGRNKHHPEYWTDNNNYLIMPYKFAIESICDRIAACKTYKGKKYTNSDPLIYWEKQKSKGYKINEKITQFYDIVFLKLKENGEAKVLNKKFLFKIYNEISNNS